MIKKYYQCCARVPGSRGMTTCGGVPGAHTIRSAVVRVSTDYGGFVEYPLHRFIPQETGK